MPCTLKGYKRTFQGIGPIWEYKSVATVTPDENEEINAFAFLMTPEDIALMDKYEGIPSFYTRVEVELTDRIGEAFRGFVYIMTPKETFEFPSSKYLDV